MINKKRMFGLSYDDSSVPEGLVISVRTMTGQTSGAGLCSVGVLSKPCYVDPATPGEINSGDTIYNPDLTPLSGADKYYLVSFSTDPLEPKNVRVNNSGVITAITSC
jgi:hypothetical protein